MEIGKRDSEDNRVHERERGGINGGREGGEDSMKGAGESYK